MANTGANYPVKTFDTTVDSRIEGSVVIHAITLSASDVGNVVVTDIPEGNIIAELRVPANGTAVVTFPGGYTTPGGFQITTLTGLNARVCVYT